MIGDDLHFDVARRQNQLLHEDGGIAEGFERFGAGAFKGLRELGAQNSRDESRGRHLPQVALIRRDSRVARRGGERRRAFLPHRRSKAPLVFAPARASSSWKQILSPSRRMTSPSGPMKTIPSRGKDPRIRHVATKPHPTQTASARALANARSSRS